MLSRNSLRFLAMKIANGQTLSHGLREMARNVRRWLCIASPFAGGRLATKCLIHKISIAGR